MVAPADKVASVCAAARAAHSYETPVIDVYPLREAPENCGIGRIGRLSRPVTVSTLIGRIKKVTGLGKVLLSAGRGNAGGDGKGRLVSIAACCAGSCRSTYKPAIAGGATFYLTGEMRHHDALAAASEGVNVVCLGHSNSERITLKHLTKRLAVQLPKLEVLVAKSDRDPLTIV